MNGPLRTRTYYGENAVRQFEADAAEAASFGYVPTSQTWYESSLTVIYQQRDRGPASATNAVNETRLEAGRKASAASGWNGAPMRGFVKVGALWLMIVGGLLCLGGAGCTVIGVTSMGNPGAEPKYDELRLGIAGAGFIVGAIGAGHVVAGVGMWNQRTRGRWLGAALGMVGLILTAIYWAGQHIYGAGQLESWPLAVPALGYGLTLAAAIVWYPHQPVGPGSH